MNDPEGRKVNVLVYIGNLIGGRVTVNTVVHTKRVQDHQVNFHTLGSQD